MQKNYLVKTVIKRHVLNNLDKKKNKARKLPESYMPYAVNNNISRLMIGWQTSKSIKKHFYYSPQHYIHNITISPVTHSLSSSK